MSLPLRRGAAILCGTCLVLAFPFAVYVMPGMGGQELLRQLGSGLLPEVQIDVGIGSVGQSLLRQLGIAGEGASSLTGQLSRRLRALDEPAAPLSTAGLLLQLREADGAQAIQLRTSLGRLYSSLGRYAEAAEHLREAYRLAGRAGQDPARLAETQTDLGIAYLRRGRLPDAKRELERALPAAGEEVLPRLLQNLGNERRDAGRVEEALRLYARAMLLHQNGETSGRASLLNDIGSTHLMRGEIDEAMAHFQEAALHRTVATSTGVGQQPKIDAATSLVGIGEVTQMRGDSALALKQFQEALGAQQRLLPAGHPDVVRTLARIARAQRNLGRPAEALQTVARAEALLDASHELEHALLLGVKSEMLRELGRLPLALSAIRKALSIQLALTGDENNPEVAGMLNLLGSVLHDQQRYEDALVHYQRSLKASRASIGDESPDGYVAHNNLATLYQDMGDSERARVEFTRALEIQLKTVGASSPDVSACYNNIATVLFQQGKLEEADKLLDKALAAADQAKVPRDNPERRIYTENHEEVVMALRKRSRQAAADRPLTS